MSSSKGMHDASESGGGAKSDSERALQRELSVRPPRAATRLSHRECVEDARMAGGERVPGGAGEVARAVVTRAS